MTIRIERGRYDLAIGHRASTLTRVTRRSSCRPDSDSQSGTHHDCCYRVAERGGKWSLSASPPLIAERIVFSEPGAATGGCENSGGGSRSTPAQGGAGYAGCGHGRHSMVFLQQARRTEKAVPHRAIWRTRTNRHPPVPSHWSLHNQHDVCVAVAINLRRATSWA